MWKKGVVFGHAVAVLLALALQVPLAHSITRTQLLSAAAQAGDAEDVALLDLLSQDPELNTLFAGPNTTGGTLRAHTLAVLKVFREQVALRPAVAQLLSPHLPLLRVAIALHDIGKPAALLADGHSKNQSLHTARVLARCLPQWGWSADEQKLMRTLLFEPFVGGLYGFGRRLHGPRGVTPPDAVLLRTRMQALSQVPGMAPEAFLAAHLLYYMADASFYGNVRAATFLSDGPLLRIRSDDAMAPVVEAMTSLHPQQLPVESFLKTPRGHTAADADYVPREALTHRWSMRDSGHAEAYFGVAITREGRSVDALLQDFATHGLTRRISVDLTDPFRPALLDGLLARLHRTLAPLRGTPQARATLVIVHADRAADLEMLSRFVRPYGVAVMQMLPVRLMDPALGARIARSEYMRVNNANSVAHGYAELTALRTEEFVVGEMQSTDLQVIQINDLYELAGPNPDSTGGLDRVAHYVRLARARHPQTLFVHAGDALSPSVFNAASVGGAPLNGRHMIDVLNQMQLDLLVPGNHDFDLGLDVLRDRIAESRFVWLNCNIRGPDGQLLAGTVPYVIKTMGAKTVAFIGVSIGARKDGTRVDEPIAAVRNLVDQLRGRADHFVVISHLPKDVDLQLAQAIPEVRLVIGGHEHEGISLRAPSTGTHVAKAASNARTLYFHLLREHRGKLAPMSRAIALTAQTPADPVIRAHIAQWHEQAKRDYAQQGFELGKVIGHVSEPLDGLDTSVRVRSTNLSRLLTRMLHQAVPQAQAAVMAGGAVRIDDVIPAGPITQFDALRVFPHGNHVVGVRIRGDVLLSLLRREPQFAQLSVLHRAGIEEDRGEFGIGGGPIDPQQSYLVAMTDHLARNVQSMQDRIVHGGNTGPDIVEFDAGDIRNLLMRYIEKVAAHSACVAALL